MEVSKLKFTGPTTCGHCGNKVYMKEVAYHDQVKSEEIERITWQEDPVWRLLECPACSGVTLYYYYFDERYEPETWEGKTLYPPIDQKLEDLPPKIEKEYQEAQKVRNISSNSFAVLLGRVIEKVCADRGATGRTLHDRLDFLAEKGEIPKRLVEMAHQLRQLRNIGAHTDLGELTPTEAPILDSLCKAILEYVYVAPRLINQVASKLQELKQRTDKH